MELALRIQTLRERTPTQLLRDVTAHGPGWASALLILVIAWTLARLFWVLVPGEPEFDWSQRTASTAPTASASASRIDDRAIANARLFGEVAVDAAPVMATEAPDTRLNLRLRGTIAASDQNLAHAIIAESNGRDRVFFIDDTLPGGASLHEVYPDRVILRRGGVLETLRLPKKSLALGTAAAGPQTTAAPADAGLAGMLESGELNVTSFTDIIRPQPFMPSGELRGYRVYPGRDRRAFAALGLRPGDLVTEINGQQLNNLQQGMDIFRSMESSPQITVTLDRNGSPMVLTLDSSQLNNAAGALQ